MSWKKTHTSRKRFAAFRASTSGKDWFTIRERTKEFSKWSQQSRDNMASRLGLQDGLDTEQLLHEIESRFGNNAKTIWVGLDKGAAEMYADSYGTDVRKWEIPDNAFLLDDDGSGGMLYIVPEKRQSRQSTKKSISTKKIENKLSVFKQDEKYAWENPGLLGHSWLSPSGNLYFPLAHGTHSSLASEAGSTPFEMLQMGFIRICCFEPDRWKIAVVMKKEPTTSQREIIEEISHRYTTNVFLNEKEYRLS